MRHARFTGVWAPLARQPEGRGAGASRLTSPAVASCPVGDNWPLVPVRHGRCVRRYSHESGPCRVRYSQTSWLCVGFEKWLTQVRQASIRPSASTGEPAAGSADAPGRGFVMPSGTTCPSPSHRRRGRSDQRCPAHCVGRATSSRRATPTPSSMSPHRGVSCDFVGRASSTGARKRTFSRMEDTVTRPAPGRPTAHSTARSPCVERRPG
jgi:hypothetical protein